MQTIGGKGTGPGDDNTAEETKGLITDQERYKTGAIVKKKRPKTIELELGIPVLTYDKPCETWAPPKPITKPMMHLRPPSFVPIVETKSLVHDYREGPPEAFFQFSLS